MDEEEMMNEQGELDQAGALNALANSLSELTNPSTTTEAQTYARKFLNKQLDSPIYGQQQTLVTEMEKNAAQARDTLRAAREKLMARRYNPSDKWFSLAAALGAPTKVGGVGDLASRASTALGESSQRRRAFEEKRDVDVLGLDKESLGVDQQLLKLKLDLLVSQGKIDSDLAKEALKVMGRPVKGSTTQNKAQQAVDREFAKDYVEFIQTGAPEGKKSIDELRHARDRLLGYTTNDQGERVKMPKEEDFLTRQLGPTGAVAGSIATVPFAGKAIQDVLMPGGADIREQVEATVQGSLRPILGAQFTEKEGERLIARVYNPRLKPEVNGARVNRLVTMLEEAFENKMAAAQYYEEHGTLAGFKGKINYTIADFMPKDINELSQEALDEQTTEAGTHNPDDDAPAVDPNAPAEPAHRTAPDGRRIYKPSELPKRRKRNFLGFAEGGAVAEPDTILVEMEDGTFQEFPADATQEDVLGGDDGGDYDSVLSRSALAGLGAGAGYVTARGGLGLGNKLGDMLPGRRETPAEARLLRLMERSGTRPSSITREVSRSNRAGVPMMAADASSDLVASAYESLPLAGDEGSEMIRRLRSRQDSARSRVGDQLNKGLKPDEYFEKETQLQEQLYGRPPKGKDPGVVSESSKKYAAAEAAHPSLRSKQLMKLLDTPSGQKAFKQARKALEDKGMKIGRAGVTGSVEKFSLTFLNQVKKELDDMIRVEERAGATGQGKTLRGLRDSLVKEIDTATTDSSGRSLYVEAREQWGTDKAPLDALRAGRKDFVRMTPQEIARDVKGMSFEERDAFRTGVAQKITEMLNTPSTDLNAARRLMGSPQMRAKLAPLFDSPAELRVFETALQREAEIFENSKKLLNKEMTVRQRSADPAEGAVKRGAKKAPALGILSPTHWALKFLRERPEVTEKEATEVIKLLKSSSPDELKHFEKKLEGKFGRKKARVTRGKRAGKVGAALGAIAGLLTGGEDDEDEELEEIVERPELAGLTEGEIANADRPAMAEGGKVGMLKELVASLLQQYQANPPNPGRRADDVNTLAMKAGVTPAEVRNAMVPARPVTERRATARMPVSPEALAPYRGSLDFQRQQLQRIVDNLQTSDPARREALTPGVRSAEMVSDRMNYEPTPANMHRLTELVRALQQQASEKARGGRIRRQFGGMTNHA